jgi:hypothetical protein
VDHIQLGLQLFWNDIHLLIILQPVSFLGGGAQQHIRSFSGYECTLATPRCLLAFQTRVAVFLKWELP